MKKVKSEVQPPSDPLQANMVKTEEKSQVPPQVIVEDIPKSASPQLSAGQKTLSHNDIDFNFEQTQEQKKDPMIVKQEILKKVEGQIDHQMKEIKVPEVESQQPPQLASAPSKTGPSPAMIASVEVERKSKKQRKNDRLTNNKAVVQDQPLVDESMAIGESTSNMVPDILQSMNGS